MALIDVFGDRGMKEQAQEKLGEEILAAGELRQGKPPSMAAMISGAALIELLRPRKSKALPKHFVLAVTPDRVAAFKAFNSSDEDNSDHRVILRGDVEATWPRGDVSLADLAEGVESKGGTLVLGGESVPVARPNLSGDPETDELFSLLGGRG